MIPFISAIIILLAGAIVTAFAGRRSWANGAGTAFAVVGAILAVAGCVDPLFHAQRWEWALNQGTHASVLSIHLAMDPLSAFFCMVTSVITGIAAVYGSGYLKHDAGVKNLGVTWSFYLVLSASMLLVETAWDGVLFLVVWEIMSLSSFFLVIFDGEKPEVLKSGWLYLVATHFATACLMVMFLMMGNADSFSFGSVAIPESLKGVVFILSIIGFGTKAGFFPFHVWLPEAHPAAPSHVSAVMSGVMVKAGIYGILRICVLNGPPQIWWGWTLVVMGAVTGIGGVLFALAQKDLKRLLAYSTVENVGIIAMGLGLGLIGIATNHPVLTVLGITGGLMHVMNHAVFKSLLFLGAGSILHATGSRNMERMGGLMKRMESSGAMFMLASASICALPPLNGFVSEFLIYLGSFKAFSGQHDTSGALASILVISALAMIGGLAAACFTRTVGIVFLGEPRSQEADKAVESDESMIKPMLLLGGLCIYLGFFGFMMIHTIQPAVRIVTGQSPEMTAVVEDAFRYLAWITVTGMGLAALILCLGLIRKMLLARRVVSESVTWDCGYSAPNVRMQYTASSFSDPVTTMFQSALRSEKRLSPPQGFFPMAAAIETRTGDVILRRFYTPIFRAVAWVSEKLHGIKRGYNQVYILYIVLALLSLLLWTFH
ncbi:MAG: proton-conducting transporter membrane subunit [Desulfobacteraceae bacterium]|nr:proton-conducting transporter membrane subunit [Desulfobacteraceae bacterium]